MATFCIDWDGTIVDPKTQEWLPGAQAGLRRLHLAAHTVVVLSSRASWDGGRDQIERKLRDHRLSFAIEAKPLADLYIDDRAFRFDNWPDTLAAIKRQHFPRPRT